jgi:putative FmdB family regulatory protein
MPIYEYRCSDCGHKLEALQKLADAPMLTCPACGEDALIKLVSAAGFQLKGSGWYVTDFKGSGGKPADKAADGNGGEAKADGAKTDGVKADSAKANDAKAAPSTGESKSEVKSDANPAATSTVTSSSTPTTPATGSGNNSA